MKKVCYNLSNEKVQHLVKNDEKLSLLINHIKSCELNIETDGFKCLVKYIIGQQISDKARETIWQRLCSNLEEIKPSNILRISDNELRKSGLSYSKILYIKELAINIVENNINFKKIKGLSDDEIIEVLTSVKGIGRWTAEMYLIFSLGRENVIPREDGTIKRTIKWMYDLENLPTKSEIERIFQKWNGYSTIVSAFLWKSIELNLTQKTFIEML